jgi:hypothetical protein
MQRFREQWARDRSEFECVGGPLDGEVVPASSSLSVYVKGGVYEHGADYRLYYQQLAASWKESDQC